MWFNVCILDIRKAEPNDDPFVFGVSFNLLMECHLLSFYSGLCEGPHLSWVKWARITLKFKWMTFDCWAVLASKNFCQITTAHKFHAFFRPRKKCRSMPNAGKCRQCCRSCRRSCCRRCVLVMRQSFRVVSTHGRITSAYWITNSLRNVLPHRQVLIVEQKLNELQPPKWMYRASFLSFLSFYILPWKMIA